jgi:7-cyano-7-deazaguanine synthase in queuosine biosynthesis
MSEIRDYTYTFSDIKNSLGHVGMSYGQESQNIEVAIRDKHLLIRKASQMPSFVADAVDLALAVHLADRLSVPDSRSKQPCNIKIVLPVRRPEKMGQTEFLEQLIETLFWYTGNYWSFEFRKRLELGRKAEIQSCLPFYDNQTTEVALWSGGLDSLAGLYNRLESKTAEHYTLFGTGSNNSVHQLQETIAKELREEYKHIGNSEIKLIQVPIQLNNTKDLAKNFSQRSRGFVFLLLGAVCAYLEGQNHLYIYENGIGAINLPFRAAEIGLDHARSVHPLSLVKMGKLVSAIFNMEFEFRNPFLFYTKGQLCRGLKSKISARLIADTVSCDRKHRNEVASQCGYCSSCLLRRQGILSQGIEDQTKYITQIFHEGEESSKTSQSFPLKAMLRQAADLRTMFNSENIWINLVQKYPRLADIADLAGEQYGYKQQEMAAHLIELYKKYAEEWNNKDLQQIISVGLLDDEALRAVA